MIMRCVGLAALQSLAVLVALWLTCTRFDGSELNTIALCWPVFLVAETWRSGEGEGWPRRASGVLASAGMGALILAGGLGVALAWDVREIGAEIRTSISPSVLVRYDDEVGRVHRISVPRYPGEGAAAHRERAETFVRLMEAAFPRRE